MVQHSYYCRNIRFTSVLKLDVLYHAQSFHVTSLVKAIKFAKNRLRSSIGQELLEAMLVCSTETDLLRSIPNDRIYEKLAEQSTEMKRLLMFKTYSLDCRLQSHHILIVVVTVI